MTKKNEVTVKNEVAVKNDQLPDYLSPEMLAELSGVGMSHDMDDSVLPLLRVFQPMSPQVDKSEPDYIEGSEAGMIWLRGTDWLWESDKGFWFVQVGFEHVWNEWVPRDEGGGFRGRHPSRPREAREVLRDERKPDKGKKWINPDTGTEFIETRNHFGLILPDEDHPDIQGPEPAVMPLSSTGHSFSKTFTGALLRNKINGRIKPSFMTAFLIKTKQFKNDDGRWYQFVLGGEKYDVDGDTFEVGRHLAEQVKEGAVRADVDGAEENPHDDGVI